MRGNLAFRKFVLAECKRDAKYRKAVLAMCAEDILFFVNVFVWQTNPNSIGDASAKYGPFITWKYQEEAVHKILWCIENRSDLVIEKSREMGASWLCLIVMTWFLIFKELTAFLAVSRNADAVDKAGDPNCLFWKIDFILKHLPEWVADTGPGQKITRRVMGYVNNENGATLTGQATTEDMGVGGRCDGMFLDEFSKVKSDWKVVQDTADTSGCRIFNGTHTGTQSALYDLATRTDGTIEKLQMHWSMHPDKNQGLYHFDAELQRVVYHDQEYKYDPHFRPVTDGSPTGGPFPGLRSPWYDSECRRRKDARGIAANLDINPAGTTEQVFDALMVQDLKARYCRPPRHTCDLAWDRESATPSRLFEEKAGKIKLWCRLDKSGMPPRDTYVFACDIAYGTGASPSCLAAYNAAGEKCLSYDNAHIEPKDFAYLAVALCRLFTAPDGSRPKLVWETPGPGLTFGKHVLNLQYGNIYLRTPDHRINKGQSKEPGWNNNAESLKFLIDNYKDALREKRVINHCEISMNETLNFVYKPDGYVAHNNYQDPKNPSGARVNHGDHVIADALCCKLLLEGPMRGNSPVAAAATEGVPQTAEYNTLAYRRALATMGENSDWL